MDGLGFLVLFTAVVLAVGLPVVRLRGTAPGPAARRVRAAATLATLDPSVRRAAAALGNVIVIDAGGRDIVYRVAEHHKRMAEIEENRWYLGRSEPDDILVEWLPYAGSGGTLRVARAIGSLGRPPKHGDWLRLLDTVERIAGDSGRAFERRLGDPLVPSGAEMPGLIVWVPSGSHGSAGSR